MAAGAQGGGTALDVYEGLGIQPFVNAWGPMTRFGGGIMAPEVASAMLAATQACVDILELQARASRMIAELTGAEAGCITSGAAAAVLVGTAACVTGMDPGKMNRLPDTAGMRNQVIVMRSQRNSYDHALRAVGVTLIEVGLSDRFSGTGLRDSEAWEIKDAITDETAAIFYVAKPFSLPKLPEVAAIAHEAGLPLLVDAAAELPPAGNLRRFIAEGADLVAFSGGKAINGPQGSGILCGRRDLVGAALLQQIDLDYIPEEWEPPRGLIDGRNLPGLPRHGIGRSCKVGKEQIVGALTALRLFAREGDDGRRKRLHAVAEAMVGALCGLTGLSAAIIADPAGTGMPVVEIALDLKAAPLSGKELLEQLRKGSPRIEANPWRAEEGRLILSPACLRAGDPALIGRRLREILQAR
jgi:D-glucosaminate-6-phosphate ammonia-lyase